MQGKKEFLILGIPVLALLVWAVVDFSGTMKGSWKCSQVECGKVITAEEWVNKNCYALPENNQQVVCTVKVNETNQLVPLSLIDTSALNQCVDPICVQEVKVRNVNYSISNFTRGG